MDDFKAVGRCVPPVEGFVLLCYFPACYSVKSPVKAETTDLHTSLPYSRDLASEIAHCRLSPSGYLDHMSPKSLECSYSPPRGCYYSKMLFKFFSPNFIMRSSITASS